MDRCKSIPGRFDENILFSTIRENGFGHQALRQWYEEKILPMRWLLT